MSITVEKEARSSGLRKFLFSLGPIIGLILFVGALWVLYHSMKDYHLRDLRDAFVAIPYYKLFIALLLTSACYFLMTCYDVLAFRYINHPLPYKKIALASFVGYSLSNNLGYSFLSGGTVRYRFYSGWGLSTIDIAKIVTFCTVSTFIGCITVGGVVCVTDPSVNLEIPILSTMSVRALGIILLAVPTVYLGMSFFGREALTIRRFDFAMPSFGLALVQVAIASIDYAMAGAVVYTLLPPDLGISFPAFLGHFIIAMLAAIISQVPGGLGVFESLIVIQLAPIVSAASLLGSLLLFRVVYYLVPLGASTLLLAAFEFRQRRHTLQGVGAAISNVLSPMVPQVFALATFACGTVLLFSGAVPPMPGRMQPLAHIVPLPLIEISHFFGSLAGVGLILLARALQRRVDAAYWFTSILLAAGVVFSLTKGLDYEEAAVLALVLGFLLPCHRHFYRKSSLFSAQFSVGWIAAVAAVILGSIWLGWFAYRHVEYSNDLWWRFSITGHAPRFLRATVGAIVLTQVFALTKLLRSSKVAGVPAHPEELREIEEIVAQSPDTTANLALLGDKTILFNDKENAFIMYGIEGRSWVSMGDPVGPEEERRELIWKFRELCDRNDAWPVFYHVRAENVHLYIDVGLDVLKLGEEGRVDLQKFTMEGGARKEERHSNRKLENDGCTFEIVPPDAVPAILGELKAVSDDWLQEKNTREKGFSLGFFNESYLRRYAQALVRRHGEILAFANIWQSGQREELSLDLMRYRSHAPSGIMDYLFINLMLWGKEQGYRWFDLGMAPLAGLENRSLAPFLHRVGAQLFRHGEHFYNFQGLRQYKDKFDPVWQPRYLASPGGISLPRILANVAALISGGVTGIVSK